MLVLFGTPGGYAVFKLLDPNKLTQSQNLYTDFETVESANRILNLKHFHKFGDTVEALEAITADIEGKISKSLKKTLKLFRDEVHEPLLVADSKLGISIKNKFGFTCLHNTAVQELMRCIRSQRDGLLINAVTKQEMTAMTLGLSHNLSRYRLKFSPDKVDTMVIQAVKLLDILDKQVNYYSMLCREWYGWHFPELSKLIPDNVTYLKTVNLLGMRENAISCDFSDILTEEVENNIKEAAETSMGTEMADDDTVAIQSLCTEVVELSKFKVQLYEYVKMRMMALAPNLSILVGEIVGARLMAHAGSLINLAKHPASTVQILGAEKALFRALKMKKDTPKYGLIYHSQLVGQSSKKNKGKISRMLAAKASLATRFDALGESENLDLGETHKAKLESRLRTLEENNLRKFSGTAKAREKFDKYHTRSEYYQYSASGDSTLPRNKKQLITEIDTQNENVHKKIKEENIKTEETDSLNLQEMQVEESDIKSKKKKKHSSNQETEETPQVKMESATILKKKKKRHAELKTEEESFDTVPKKKRKREEEPKPKFRESCVTEEILKLETDSDATLKKCKKRSMELKVEEESSVGKKKKEKKTSTTHKIEDIEMTPDTQEEAQATTDPEFIQKKKKKKKKNKKNK